MGNPYPKYSISWYLENEIPGWSEEDEEELSTKLILLQHRQEIKIMDELHAFTINDVINLGDVMGLSTTYRRVKTICDLLFHQFGILDMSIVATGLNPAKLYYIKDDPKALPVMDRKREQFKNYAELQKKRKTSVRTPTQQNGPKCSDQQGFILARSEGTLLSWLREHKQTGCEVHT